MNDLANSFWALDSDVIYLNHGSFGSCPRPVLEYQQALRMTMERRPMQFLVRDLESKLDGARQALADFVGADRDDLVFVPNATTGVNTVLNSLKWEPGDELLTTNHVYNACGNALRVAAENQQARVVVAEVPFPLEDADQIFSAVEGVLTSRTRIALLDHVTSETGIKLPIERLVSLCHERDVEVLVDGAHAPGMVPLNVESIGAEYYTGNCHKWICAPKGSGFLHVRRDKQPNIRPLVISHGANSSRTDRSRFQIEFGWTGTADPTAYLSIPEALRVMAQQHVDGWGGVMQSNHELVVQGRRVLCDALGVDSPCPAEMLGALASIPLSDARCYEESVSALGFDALQGRLASECAIEVPVFSWPCPPARMLRVSAQAYNCLNDYRQLAQALSATSIDGAL